MNEGYCAADGLPVAHRENRVLVASPWFGPATCSRTCSHASLYDASLRTWHNQLYTYIIILGYGGFERANVVWSVKSGLSSNVTTVCLHVHRALFAYDGVTNNLKLADSGGEEDFHMLNLNKIVTLCLLIFLPFYCLAGGVAELAGKFHISRPEYGLCKIETAETGSPRIALISWVRIRLISYQCDTQNLWSKGRRL